MNGDTRAPYLALVDCGRPVSPDGLLRLLTPEEVRRGRSFARPARAVQFLWSRLALRATLARVLACPAATLELVERAPCPPVVRGAEHLHLSVAHSGRWVMCAIAFAPIGIDVEDRAVARDTGALAEAGLPEAQRAWVRSQPDPQRAFYEMWTFNESVVKLATTPAPELEFIDGAKPRLVAPGGEQWLCRHHSQYVMTAVGRNAASSRVEHVSSTEIKEVLT